MVISLTILLIMRNLSYKMCRGNQNTRFAFKFFFFRKSCRLLDNVEKYCRAGRSLMTIWRTRIACWITKATDIHPEYVILIAFPLQRRFRERASVLHYTYIFCLVLSALVNKHTAYKVHNWLFPVSSGSTSYFLSCNLIIPYYCLRSLLKLMMCSCSEST